MRNMQKQRNGKGYMRRLLASACSISVVALAAATQVIAQEPQQPSPPAQPEPDPEIDESRIIVIGNRAIVASLQDIEPEQVYSEGDVASYAVSTIGELLDEIRSENGDEDPTILVNGQRVADLGGISDLPVEAIAGIEQLPRGAGQRVGGAAGQRAYNIVLRRSVQSVTGTASHELATEGDWGNTKAEMLLTYIQGQDRLNITLRGADSDPLFESDRDLVPRAETYPYAPLGNVIPFSGTEIDPALSALAGQPVSVVALPAGVSSPTLAALLVGANQTHRSARSDFRSLRGAARPFELAIAGNKTLTEWLSLSVNGRLNWARNDNYSGIPSARFLIPAANPYSPFSRPVYLALSDPSRRLRNTSNSTTGNLTATLNATFGAWDATAVGRYDERERDYISFFTGSLGGDGTVDAATNPFDGGLAQRIPIGSRVSRSKTTTKLLSADAQGPLLMLWAGSAFARVGASATRVELDASDTSGNRTFDRSEYMATAGITVPLTSTEFGFLSGVGASEVAFDIGRVDMGRFGSLERHSVALNWQPIQWFRLSASQVQDQSPIYPELLAAPEVVTPNVPYFDPLTGETVDVTTIYGGAAGLEPEQIRTRTLSVTANPQTRYRLRLNADYVVNDTENQIGALPPPSSAVVAAFPDRFVRDGSGTLITVDNRSVNFARQHTRSLRVGGGATIPLTQPVTIPADREAGTPRRRLPGLNLQVNGAHTYLLESKSVIRVGLPEIDLLEGGAIGLGGGRPRHSTDFNVALSKGSSGLRASLRRRRVSQLVTGAFASPDLLTFDSLTSVDLKAFTDLGDLFPRERSLKSTRVTVSIDNLFNARQTVTNAAGVTPQAYQPVYRDPIGRTLQVELRKVF